MWRTEYEKSMKEQELEMNLGCYVDMNLVVANF